ncbi:undecaprenyl diphosphate synthase family protein [Nocardia ninae]|uniref:(2Z,6E)-farnesyl diphosphate synthase n=1 Tax=Nocardia ninae NBRC 108245 TaxID=1210091 RepID=A0A511MF70_9NOCA|nr:undecaprenyl diphosphate synthase family protein [Nocardia ninae]GEM38516.1 (2Z,6E)-farnesyl diphosphate synthase [Nocardia ninae NBRC 108245]
MTPGHVGVVLGGSARWAESSGRSVVEAYQRTCAKQLEIVEWCWAAGVAELTLQVVSPEPAHGDGTAREAWGNVLDRLFRGWPAVPVAALNLVGNSDIVPENLASEFGAPASASSRSGDGIVLNLVLGYEGRQEIVDGVRTMLATAHRAGAGLSEVVARLDSEYLDGFLATGTLSPIDFVIRTSADKHVLGFLPWKSAYAEFYVTGVSAPDLSVGDFTAALKDYSHRKRRFGR